MNLASHSPAALTVYDGHLNDCCRGGAIFSILAGTLLIEHGNTQHKEIAGILNMSGWEHITLAKDLAGQPRITIASRPGYDVNI